MGAYIFHALSASPMVRDVDVSRPVPGTAGLGLISTAANLEPDAALLDTVSAYLSADTRRPLNDTATVAAAELIDYDITATLRCYPRAIVRHRSGRCPDRRPARRRIGNEDRSRHQRQR